MKKWIKALALLLAIGAAAQAVTSYVANAQPNHEHGTHEPGP
jgi:hypothetical protein